MSTNNDIFYKRLELKKHNRFYKFFNHMLKCPYVLIAPATILAIWTSVIPILMCIGLSFCNWDLIGNIIKWTGFRNYRYIFTNDIFIVSLKNTIVFTLVTVFAGLALKIVLGVFLNRNTHRHNFVQTVMFTPHIISSVALVMVFKLLMLPKGGLLNQIIEFFHGKPLWWYMDSATSLMSIMILSIWSGLGYGVLLVIAGLKSIPNYVYDAAKLDNAGKSTIFFRITMPLLSPTIFFILVTSMSGAFNSFDMIKLMTDGGPRDSSRVLALYIYQQGFQYLHYGRAMAAAVILLIITVTLSLLNFKLAGKKVHYK